VSTTGTQVNLNLLAKALGSVAPYIPKIVLVFPKSDNVFFLLKNEICLLLQTVPIYERAYLCAEVAQYDTRSCSWVCLSNV
jgi:hypothetical protein